MGDMAEQFRYYDKVMREKRAAEEPRRFEHAISELTKLKCVVIRNDANSCLTVRFGNKQIDFWPYKGWFVGRKPFGQIRGRGIKLLVEVIKKCQSK